MLPTSAELALDRAISAGADGSYRNGRGVIEEFTRRRWLVEDLGVVSFFPVSCPGALQRAAIVSTAAEELPLDQLIVVERDRSRADLIHAACAAAVVATPQIRLDPEVETGETGQSPAARRWI